MALARGRKVIAGLAVLALIPILGACAADNPGTAVESLGTRYSEADVTVVADQLGKLFGQPLPRNAVVQTLAQTEPMLELADSVGMTVTQEQLDSVAEMFMSPASTIDPSTLSEATKRVLAASAVSQPLGQVVAGQEDLYDQFVQMQQPPYTVVNPRYFVSGQDGLEPAGLLADTFGVGQAADGSEADGNAS